MYKKLITILLILFFVSNAFAWCSGTDCNTDWEYKQELTLNTESVLTSDVTNEHAILVHIDSSNTDFWENVGAKQSIGPNPLWGDLNTNLEAYYKLDETSGTTYFDSVNSYDGTNSNAIINQTGIIDKAYSFNGTNSYLYGSYVHGYTDFSNSMWIKFTDYSSDQKLFDMRYTSSPSPVVAMGVNSNKVYGQFRSNTGSGLINVQNSTTLTNNQWYFVAMTFKQSTGEIKVYVNAGTPATGTYTGGDFGNIDKVAIGSQEPPSSVANGLIDEMGFWNRILTEEEIKQLYSSQVGGYDVRFTNSNDSIDLNYHFELVDTDTNDLWAWVRIPSFDADANTTINMYYGNPNAIDNQNQTGTYPTTYRMVQHLNTFNDSTNNNYNGTNNGTTDITGFIDGAKDFELSSSNYIRLPTGISTGLNGLSAQSISLWVKKETNGVEQFLFDDAITSTNAKYLLNFNSSNTIRLGARSRSTDSFQSVSTTNTFTSTSNYYNIIGTVDLANNDIKIYVNGSAEATAGTPSFSQTSWNSDTGTNTPTIGTATAGSANFFDGVIDEFKLFNYELNSDESSLLYNSENQSLITFGTQETSIGVTADFNYTNDASNSRVYLYDTSTDTNTTINSWTWKINGTTQSTDQNFYFTTSANQDLNTCLTASGLGTDGNTYSDTLCQSVLTWDTENPTIDVNITPSTFGFTSTFDIDYNMVCSDNFSTINYEIIQTTNGVTTTIYDSDDANNSLKTGTVNLSLGDSTYFTFNCNDAYNTATYTSDTYYAVQFRLVNEETGVPLTPSEIGTDFNSARVFTPDGNFTFDFQDANNIDTNFFSTSNDLWFEFQYKDASNTKINRQIDFSYTEDSNAAICVPDFQTFYQQRFVANSAKAIVIKNNVSECYIFAGQLQYAYDTGYSLTTYLIPLPYYLYTWIDGVKTYLALLDGGVPTAYNIDAIIFSRQGFTINVGQDTVAFAPLKNSSGIYDTNTIQIYYDSYDETNTKLELTIKDSAGDSIWNYTEYTEPNELLVNFYWGGLDVNLDEILTLQVTKTNSSGETSTSNYYFTLYGGSYQDNVSNEWAVILAVLFFLFGITLVAYDKALGLFGIIIGIVALFFVTLASGAWWVSLISSAFVILIAYIFLLSRSGGSIK